MALLFLLGAASGVWIGVTWSAQIQKTCAILNLLFAPQLNSTPREEEDEDEDLTESDSEDEQDRRRKPKRKDRRRT